MKNIYENSNGWVIDSIKVLYQDEDGYTAIWGTYRDTNCLGVRWDSRSEWFKEPDFIASAILQRLHTKSIDSINFGYLDNIVFAINELNKQVPEFDNQKDY